MGGGGAGQIPQNQNWLIIDGVPLTNYNQANVAAGRAQPTAGARELVKIYLKEQVGAGAPDPRGIPASRAWQNAAVPRNPLNEFGAAAAQDQISTSAVWGTAPHETPYIRGSFIIDQHEPFFSPVTGLVSYPDVLAPFDNVPRFMPLLIQDSRFFFERDTSEVHRCISMENYDAGRLSCELVGQAELGVYLRDDVQQSEKNLSIVNIKIPRLETYSFDFTTIVEGSEPSLRYSSQFGMPEMLFIRCKVDLQGRPNSPPEDYFARINNFKLRIFGHENSLLKTVKYRELRELTRINSHVFSEKQGYSVLLKLSDLGTCGAAPEHERIDLEFTLYEIEQHVNYVAATKKFILVPIYDVSALQGTLEQIRFEEFYKE
jgi:hypothetical protein